MDTYFQIAMVVFLTILMIVKYDCKDKLREWIEEYLADISPCEEIEEEGVVELEEVADMIYEFVIENKKIFSRIHHKE